MRGDRPYRLELYTARKESPPRARGSTFWAPFEINTGDVSPACAGIDPLPRIPSQTLVSPRARGSTPTQHEAGRLPACAGCLLSPYAAPEDEGLPRVRGDRP